MWEKRRPARICCPHNAQLAPVYMNIAGSIPVAVPFMHQDFEVVGSPGLGYWRPESSRQVMAGNRTRQSSQQKRSSASLLALLSIARGRWQPSHHHRIEMHRLMRRINIKKERKKRITRRRILFELNISSRRRFFEETFGRQLCSRSKQSAGNLHNQLPSFLRYRFESSFLFIFTWFKLKCRCIIQ